MRNHRRQLATPPKQSIKPLPVELEQEILLLYNSDQWAQLEIKASTTLSCYANNFFCYKALGKAIAMLARPVEALIVLNKALKLCPQDAYTLNEIGGCYEMLGKFIEAEASYRAILKHHPTHTETLNSLGNLLAGQGKHAEAEAYFQQSIRINPHNAATYSNLGALYFKCGRLNLALTNFQQALALDPNYFHAWFNLGLTQQGLEQLAEAQVSFHQALTLNPTSDITLLALGRVLNLLKNQEVASFCLKRATEINPHNADAFVSYGNVLYELGQTAEAWNMYRKAQAIRPFITQAANRVPPAFSVLVLDTPNAGCTPVNYLLNNSAYESHLYCLIPDEEIDFEYLRSKGQLVFNIISDADNGKKVFAKVLDTVERLGLPVVNHPRQIMHSDRATIARLIADIPHCVTPKIQLYAGKSLLEALAQQRLTDFHLPVLVRQAGTHGGDIFEKFTDFMQIAEFVSKQPELDYYVSDFIDYQSADGYFRKYRLFYINDELLPYHLAIHNDWLVHYFRTDMTQHSWMQAEEAAFLEEPQRVFTQTHQTALITLAKAIGLNFLGIDCTIDQNGEVLIFEANATMRVHYENNEIFAYKNPYIDRIKVAFDTMLTQLAAG
jgi:tetratricopeptide (TPR) repeat protein